MKRLLNVSSSPHARSSVLTHNLMYDVAIAMIPAAAFGVFQFGLSALLVIIATVASCVLSEYVFEKVMKKPITIADGSDEQIRALHPGGAQGAHGGGVALHDHHIIAGLAGGKHFRVGVDDGQVIALPGKLAGNGAAHLAVACNNDLHIDSSLPGQAAGAGKTLYRITAIRRMHCEKYSTSRFHLKVPPDCGRLS